MPLAEFKASDAKLITRLSQDRSGLGAYVVKQNFRRDMDQDIRREGYDYFWPIKSGDYVSSPGQQPFPNGGAGEPITLIHLARRPNGEQAILVGTPTKLWRFYGTESGAYFADDYFTSSGPDTPYYLDESGAWKLIGSGFSAQGHRWEAEDINGFTVLNNGVDLPMTYRIEDPDVVPIYELREQGIASVGTIGETSGILMCGDIRELHADAFEALMETLGDIDSGTVTASKPAGLGAHVFASEDFFVAAHVGRWIDWDSGFDKPLEITSLVGPREAVVAGTTFPSIPGGAFRLRNKATQASGSGAVVAASNAFTPDMVGRVLIFEDGTTRTITAVTDAKTVTVDVDMAIPSQFFELNNTISYDPVTDETAVDRIQYRILWSMVDEPRRFGSTVGASMEKDTNLVTLKFPTRSFEVGQEIVIAGAGINGGNLTADIVMVSGAGQNLMVSESAKTTVTDGFVEQTDAFGGIVGFEDLQDDSSAILRIKNLSDVLIIYKETCIFTGLFTGSTENPFEFTRLKLPKGLSLFYRWTLVDVGGQFHTYAGINSFYRFDLSSKVPSVIDELEAVSDIFFKRAKVADMERIYGADNGITNELWFYFQNSETIEHALCLDYKYSSVSVLTDYMSAAATVKRPTTGVEITEDLFMLGAPNGTLLLYGKADQAQASWGNVKEIFYKRIDNPFNAAKQGYQSVLESGWGDFGTPDNIKDLKAYVLYLASQSPDCGLHLNLYGIRNPSEDGTTRINGEYPPEKGDELINEYINTPERTNLRATFFRHHFFKWRIMIDRFDNPVRICRHTFEVDGVDSASHERRP